jgi:hypothetical protein
VLDSRWGEWRSARKHFQERAAQPQISPLRSPGFPVKIRGVDQYHAVFLRKTAHVVVASSAKQEIRVRFGRDDKVEADVERNANPAALVVKQQGL